MTESRRVILNVIATYGRSLYTLVAGLFIARWALAALGQVDYGLIGLIGGLTFAVTFLNGLLASAVGRFYAFHVGAAKKAANPSEGLETCRKWFNTALVIHSVLPVILLAIGYPIGVWAIEHFLTIQPDRVSDCLWVWRFSCAACFVGMVTVPFQAMYTAKQEIAELTLYGFATTTANLLFVSYMVTHPNVWLAKYSAWLCAAGVVPALIVVVRAMIKYPECRIVSGYLLDTSRYGQIFYYVFARFWSEFTQMLSGQGQGVLVNKYMGPAYNASMAIGYSVATHAATFASAVDSAFWPVITNKAGEGDVDVVRRLCFTVFRLSALMVLIFAIPLALEIDEVLKVWLKTPPDFAAEICLVVLFRVVLDRMTSAIATAINALGRGVMLYSWTVGWAGVSIVAVSWILFACGWGMWSIIIGLGVSKFITVGVRLWLGRRLVGFPVRAWLRRVLLPLTLLTAVVVFAGLGVRVLMQASFTRIIITSAVCEIVFLSFVWKCVLDFDERAFVLSRVDYLKRRMGLKNH